MRRRVVVMVAGIFVASAAAARAQTATRSRGYAEAVAQSAFGNVTSQSYGAEVGATVGDDVQVFVDVGQVRNAAGSDMTAGADRIVAALNQLQSSPVAVLVKQPIVFGIAGIRYLIPVTTTRVEPYVLAGFGVARVKNDVTFQLGGADASASTLSQYVTLGTDLSGSATNAMLSLGGGVAWPVVQRLVVDFQYRYGRVFADPGINVSRAGVGIGVRF